jgi:iron(III) transport system permease protein
LTIAVRRSWRPPPLYWLILLPSIALICLPILYVGLRSWQAGPAEIAQELLRERTRMLLVNTLTIGFSVTVAASLIGTAAAWCVERCDLPARGAWRILASLPLAIPAFVSSFAWASLDGAFQGMAGAILILTLASYPLVFLPVCAALRSTDQSLEDVSRSLGRGPWRTFFGAVLPQIRPAIGAAALLVLTHMFAEFGALSLLRVQTFTTAIFQSYELQFDSASAASLAAVLMLLCLPAIYVEMRLRQRTQVARVGRGNARRLVLARLGRAKLPVVIAFGALAAVSLGVPTFMLVYWLVFGSSFGQGGAELWPAIVGSFSLTLPGAAIVVLFAVPLVLVSTRRRGWFVDLADRLPYIVHGLPGQVIALALVFLSIRYAPAIYQTAFLLLLAYVMLFLPQAQSALRASVELVPPRLEELARSLGRGPLNAFASITVPNIAPGIGAALALMVLEIMRELTATLMLAPTGIVTLATEVWSHTNDGEYAAAAPFAALLVGLSALPVYFFTRPQSELFDL